MISGYGMQAAEGGAGNPLEHAARTDAAGSVSAADPRSPPRAEAEERAGGRAPPGGGGGYVLSPDPLRARRRSRSGRAGSGAPGGRLTGRELQVLALLGEGRRPKLIAEELGLSITTVRNHVRAILRKLDCHSQLEAVAVARRRSVI